MTRPPHTSDAWPDPRFRATWPPGAHAPYEQRYARLILPISRMKLRRGSTPALSARAATLPLSDRRLPADLHAEAADPAVLHTACGNPGLPGPATSCRPRSTTISPARCTSTDRGFPKPPHPLDAVPGAADRANRRHRLCPVVRDPQAAGKQSPDGVPRLVAAASPGRRPRWRSTSSG